MHLHANTGGMSPPHDTDIERACIGTMLAGEDVPMMAKADWGVSPDMFYAHHNQTLCRAIYDMAEARKGQIEPLMLGHKLRSEGLWDEVGGMEYLQSCMDAAPISIRAGEYFAQLRKLYDRREMIRVSQSILQDAYEQPIDRDGLLQEAPERFYDLMPKRTEGRSMESILNESIETWRQIQDGSLQMKGLSTGIADLDYKLGGLRPGSYYAIGARTSCGKTALAGQIAQHFNQQGRATAWVNNDMPETDLYERNLCRLAGVSLAKLNSVKNHGRKYCGEKDFANLEEAKKEIVNHPAHYLHAEREVSKICSWVRLMKMRHDIQLVVIDFLQNCYSDSVRSSEKVRQVGYASAKIKEMCQQLQVSLIMLAQLNRGSVNDSRPPTLADFKECGSIEEDAQACILLSMEPKFPYRRLGLDERNTRALWLDIAKQQSGGTGRGEYWMYAPYFKLEAAQDMWGHPEAFEK